MSFKKKLLQSLLLLSFITFVACDDDTTSVTDSLVQSDISLENEANLIGTWYEDGKDAGLDTIIITESTFEYKKKNLGTLALYGVDGIFEMEDGLVTETIDGEKISRHEYEYIAEEKVLRVEVNAGTVNFDDVVSSVAENFYRE